MVVPIARRIVALTALVTVLSVATWADAATMFNVTNLGSSYTFHQDSSGATDAVTSGDGSHTYAFEKAIISFNVSYPTPPPTGSDVRAEYTFSSPLGSISFYRLDVGSEYINEVTPNWESVAPGFPIHDINSSGFVVGQQYGYNAVIYQIKSGDYPPIPTDLNGEIASSLNIHLTDALNIDDLGDIIAKGTLDGKTQSFLLTPNGSPTPAPEPSTLALLVVSITVLGIRAAHRRRERQHATAA